LSLKKYLSTSCASYFYINSHFLNKFKGHHHPPTSSQFSPVYELTTQFSTTIAFQNISQLYMNCNNNEIKIPMPSKISHTFHLLV